IAVWSVNSTTQVEFRVDKDGIKPTCEKVEAIQKAPPPWNKTELQAFLRLLNFYSCFLPNKATVLEPLHRLLDQSTTYIQAKQLLQTDKVLAHYDEKKPLVVVCNALLYGLVALLFHLERDGQEKPIFFASRTMTTTERNDAQIDKEALAVVFTVRKFYQYLAVCRPQWYSSCPVSHHSRRVADPTCSFLAVTARHTQFINWKKSC
uniref:Reverse transcriptase/retrotransposon-derived protein RNase H-like domain-containing protein n=1 Tax=Sinocyclocheilus grahami TaxID=75366 RepID=A0A672LAQ4_SINGR